MQNSLALDPQVLQKIQEMLAVALKDIEMAETLPQLDHFRVQYLGKKGELTEVLKELGHLPAEQRPIIGKVVNEAKELIQEKIKLRGDFLRDRQLNEKLRSETIDITLPGRSQSLGSLHPITRIRYRIEDLFRSMGFEIVEGPEVEDEYHNFEALNFPSDHPARNTLDTFYFNDGRLLRTHTSPVQIRVMEQRKPPLRILTPGKVYRCDSDQTHSPMFHQVEGLVIAENLTFSNLKGMLQEFFVRFFEHDIRLRFRASYFPFTEPSAEVDIEHQGGWLEVLGCGMVHTKVLENVGIDTEKYTGFAFGLGMDRLAMLRYGVNDLRIFFENDMRFLKQF